MANIITYVRTEWKKMKTTAAKPLVALQQQLKNQARATWWFMACIG